ncbi:MAG: gliding motility-associated C-terminal domain-containing protein [Bacteroidales bacterium]|nr:gliding motility-associated C-terminal domain-containing protein [Bacteroidales bacterium]
MNISAQTACPSNIPPATTDEGECFATVSSGLALIDPPAPPDVVTYSLTGATTTASTTGNDASGNSFNIGVTTVEYSWTGNNTCSFPLIVLPEITMPDIADLQWETDPGECFHTVVGTAFDPAVSCNGATSDDSLRWKHDFDGGGTSLNGKKFHCGTTTVTWTFYFKTTADSIVATTQTMTVTVEDTQAPAAICKDTVIRLQPGGTATVTDFQIINGGSYDNCTPSNGLTFHWSRTNFNCTHAGTDTVTLTVTDQSGNRASCTADITVRYHVDPHAAVTPSESKLCSGENTALTLSNPGFETVTSWTWTVNAPNGISGNTGGSFAAGADAVIRQTLENSGNAAQQVIYTVTPKVFQLCTLTPPIVARVWVNPHPELMMPADSNMCNDALVRIPLSANSTVSAGAAVYYDWSVTAGDSVTGYLNAANKQPVIPGSAIEQLLHNQSSAVRSVVYTVTPYLKLDNQYCTSTHSYTYTANIAPDVTFDLEPSAVHGGWNISCAGYSDGSIAVTNARGGWQDNGYDYEWNTGSAASTVEDLTAGAYGVTLRDRMVGCSAQQSVTLSEPAPLTAAVADVTKPSCNGPTGTIVLDVQGGTQAYQYEWTGPEGYVFNGPKDSTLRSGTYYITVTDTNGCSANLTAILPSMGSETPRVQWNRSVFGDDGNGDQYNISCYGAKDGFMNPSMDVTSVVVYTWKYQGEILKTDTAVTFFHFGDMFINHLDAGEYRLSVMDDMGCLYECEPQILREPDPITFTSSIPQTSHGYEIECYGDASGKITISGVTGGYGELYGAYEYLWNPAGDGQQGMPEQSGLPAGTYELTVRNKGERSGQAFYCDTTASFTLRESPEIMVKATIPQQKSYEIACFGQRSGSINIDITGSYDEYLLHWSSEDGTVTDPYAKNQRGLPAGTYVLDITYGTDMACSTRKTYTLRQPAEIQPGAVVENAACYGMRNGKIALSAEGGVPGYSYEWRSPDASLTHPAQQNQDHLGAGIYWVIITDANACIKTATFEITEPDTLLANILWDDPSCTPGADGTIAIDPSGGTPGYDIAWSNGATGVATIGGLTEGDYSVVVTDAHGCVIEENVRIKTPENLQVTAAATSNYHGYEVACFGDHSGNIRLDMQHGRPPYAYRWYLEGNPVAEIDPAGVPAGRFTVEVTDRFNCSGVTNVVELKQPEKMRIQADVRDLTCAGGGNGSAELFVSGGTAPYAYVWSTGESGAQASQLNAGTYPVHVTDRNGCAADTVIALRQPADIRILFDTDDAYCPETSDGAIRTRITGGTAPYSCLWKESGATVADPTSLKSGTHTLEVTDAQNCTATATVVIGYRSDVCLRVPNAFSPNGDGVNDVWEITVGDPLSAAGRHAIRDIYPDAVVEVYSANWGILLYRSPKGYPEPWNGKYNGKDLPVNSYMYLIRLGNRINPFTGNITIIRN